MSKVTELRDEIESIVESVRGNLAMSCEALARRSDLLSDFALCDKEALGAAMRATAIIHIYSTMAAKVDLVSSNPEQIEAIITDLEKGDDRYGEDDSEGEAEIPDKN